MNKSLSGTISKFLFYWYIIWLLLHLANSIKRMNSILNYSDMSFSDMLINYQGGFVRRGLFGEILHFIYNYAPFDYGLVVLSFILLTAFLCFSLLFFICRSVSYSPVLVISGFTLQFMALAEVVGIRRDYLSLLLCFLALWAYHRWISQSPRHNSYYLVFQLVILVAVLFHEGVFFYTFPILIIHYLYLLIRTFPKSPQSVFFRFLSFSLPIGIVMIILFRHKGDMGIAQQIWDSWQPLFLQYPRMGTENPSLGGSVYCLSCSTLDYATGCSMHNFGHLYWGWFPMLPFTILLFPSIMYLVTRANVSGISWGYSLRQVDVSRLTAIMFVQLSSMSPLFLILSCDYGRLFCYWIISSIFFYYVFRNDFGIFPQFINNLAVRFQKSISSHSFLLSPLGYMVIFVLTPCNMVGGAALGAIPLYRMIHEIPFLIYNLFIV